MNEEAKTKVGLKPVSQSVCSAGLENATDLSVRLPINADVPRVSCCIFGGGGGGMVKFPKMHG